MCGEKLRGEERQTKEVKGGEREEWQVSNLCEKEKVCVGVLGEVMAMGSMWRHASRIMKMRDVSSRSAAVSNVDTWKSWTGDANASVCAAGLVTVSWSARSAEAESFVGRVGRGVVAKTLRQCMHTNATTRCCTGGLEEVYELNRWRGKHHRQTDVRGGGRWRGAAMAFSSRSAAATAATTTAAAAGSEEDDAREQWENVLASVVKVYTGACRSHVKRMRMQRGGSAFVPDRDCSILSRACECRCNGGDKNCN